MHTSEMVLYSNLLYVSVTYVVIFREVIQGIKKLKDDTLTEVTEPIK